MVVADRDADGAADLLRCVDQPGGDPRFGRPHACQGADRHRDEREREPADQEPREQVGEVVTVHRQPREQHKRDSPTSSRPITRSLTKRPRRWTEPDSSFRRISPVQNAPPESERQNPICPHNPEVADHDDRSPAPVILVVDLDRICRFRFRRRCVPCDVSSRWRSSKTGSLCRRLRADFVDMLAVPRRSYIR
jgi:hypothetical protein